MKGLEEKITKEKIGRKPFLGRLSIGAAVLALFIGGCGSYMKTVKQELPEQPQCNVFQTEKSLLSEVEKELEGRDFLEKDGRVYFIVQSPKYATEKGARDAASRQAIMHMVKYFQEQKGCSDIKGDISGLYPREHRVKECRTQEGVKYYQVQTLFQIDADDFRAVEATVECNAR